MGCQSGFIVTFLATQWGPGAYRVELEADGRKITCSASTPLPKGHPGNVSDAADVPLGLSGSDSEVIAW